MTEITSTIVSLASPYLYVSGSDFDLWC